jgi:predicted ATP-dependent protease
MSEVSNQFINEKSINNKKNDNKNVEKFVYVKIIDFSRKIFEKHNIKTSVDIALPQGHYSHIIGQNNAVQAMTLALRYNRHVLLIGEPGTGKSLLAKAVVNEIPKNEFMLISTNNLNETYRPYVHYIKHGKFNWYKYAELNKFKPIKPVKIVKWYFFLTLIYNLFKLIININTYFKALKGPFTTDAERSKLFTDIFTFYFISSPYVLYGLYNPYVNILDVINGIYRSFVPFNPLAEGKCIYDTKNELISNFIDATGSDLNFIMGTVSHDPLAGISIKDPIEDVTYRLLKAGAIHKAHEGVLYIDEVGRLDEKTQYMLLSVLQDREAYIQGGVNSGTMSSVQSLNKLPANFRLIMAGNLETVGKIHIALRSRIKGYGYEIVMNNSMAITEENTLSLLQFIKREIKSGNHLDCTKGALIKLLYQSVLQSRIEGEFSLELRNFLGYIRTASDYAKSQNKTIFDEFDLTNVINVLPPLETQIAKSLLKDHSSSYKLIIPSRLHTTNEDRAQWQMLPLIIGLEFFESDRGYDKPINLVNLDIRSTMPDRLNRYHACVVYTSNILQKYIKTNKKLTIRFINSFIHQFDIASEHLALGILAQYYKRSYDTIYVGIINEFGKILPSKYDIELIKTALEKNYSVVTSVENEQFFRSNLKVSYIERVEDILETERFKESWL